MDFVNLLILGVSLWEKRDKKRTGEFIIIYSLWWNYICIVVKALQAIYFVIYFSSNRLLTIKNLVYHIYAIEAVYLKRIIHLELLWFIVLFRFLLIFNRHLVHIFWTLRTPLIYCSFSFLAYFQSTFGSYLLKNNLYDKYQTIT